LLLSNQMNNKATGTPLLVSNASVGLTTLGKVYIITMTGEENRFNPTFIRDFNEALDFIQYRTEGAAALVTTAASSIWTNGFDLQWIATHASQVAQFLKQFASLLERILTFPIITLAAISGHTFGGGAMFALAHDFRFMREDKGFFCIPIVTLKLKVFPGIIAILKHKHWV